jgi:hypothetical protein
MTRNLMVTVRNVYGVETVYPACDTSRLLCRLTGRKTFTHADIRTLQEIGYTFDVSSTPSATAALLKTGNG